MSDCTKDDDFRAKTERIVSETLGMAITADMLKPGTAEVFMEIFAAHCLGQGWVFVRQNKGKNEADEWLSKVFDHAASALTKTCPKLQVRLMHSIEEKR